MLAAPGAPNLSLLDRAKSRSQFKIPAALETLAEGRILLNLDQREIVLRQEPRKIIEQIEMALHLASVQPAMIETADLKLLQAAPDGLSGRTTFR
jgi:hypothetical protein